MIGGASGPDADDLVRLFVCSTAIDRLVPLSSGGCVASFIYGCSASLPGLKEGVAASEGGAWLAEWLQSLISWVLKQKCNKRLTFVCQSL